MFYYDAQLKKYEEILDWDGALLYLEKMYSRYKEGSVRNSLVGFSWLYAVEGATMSRAFEYSEQETYINIWRKYIDIGESEAGNDPTFCFIAGYTLSMHGFLIDESYETKGRTFMKKCVELASGSLLQRVAINFILNEANAQYVPLTEGKSICTQLFAGESLLDAYFTEMYS